MFIVPACCCPVILFFTRPSCRCTRTPCTWSPSPIGSWTGSLLLSFFFCSVWGVSWSVCSLLLACRRTDMLCSALPRHPSPFPHLQVHDDIMFVEGLVRFPLVDRVRTLSASLSLSHIVFFLFSLSSTDTPPPPSPSLVFSGDGRTSCRSSTTLSSWKTSFAFLWWIGSVRELCFFFPSCSVCPMDLRVCPGDRGHYLCGRPHPLPAGGPGE